MASECSRESQADAIGPDDVVGNLFVISGLREEASEVEVRSQRGRIEIGFERFIDAFVRVELEVSCIADESRGKSGKTNVHVLRWYQSGNDEIGNAGLRVVVAEEHVHRLVFIERVL